MAKLTFSKELQIDSVNTRTSSNGTVYCFCHVMDLSTGDSDRYSCSQAVYDSIKDRLPVTGTVFVKFESWFDETIKRGGKREFVYNVNC